MPKIFICYRREDSAYPAQHIYVDIANHFGSESVVFDVDTIPLGTDFREYLNKEVSKCDILLAVIGDQWIEILKQRLDEPNDFVRIEIQAALEREIPVVPILVGKASVPIEKNLPPELARLAYKQAAEVRAGPDLQTHLKRLIGGLDRLLAERKAEGERKSKAAEKRRMAKKNHNRKEKEKREAIPKTFKNSIDMNFVLIPPGKFLMGSPISSEGVARHDGGNKDWYEKEFPPHQVTYEQEHPPHEVTISKAFYLQSTAVTRGQWKKVMEANPSIFKEGGDGCPVENISWNDAQEFIKKLNRIDGTDSYRLPTEAEWEYACRAGTTTDFSFGDDARKLGEYAWYWDNSEGRTNPVEKKEPNAWGLYDMHGNVLEYVEDDWQYDYEGAPTDERAWVDEPSGASCVIRGGSWGDSAQDCRSAYRRGGKTDIRGYDVGFRLARSVTLGH